jgi:hypothetical protein
MMNAYVALRVAEVYARRVEWMKSGDDGYDSFIERTDEDLEELEKQIKFTVNKPTEYDVNDMRACLVQLVEAVADMPEFDEYELEQDEVAHEPLSMAIKRARELVGGNNDKSKVE